MKTIFKMSALKFRSPNTDYDAAEALLDLQNVSHGAKKKENIEDTANLFLSCFITSNVRKPVNSCVRNQNKENETLPEILIKSENISHRLKTVPKSCNKRSRLFKRRPTKYIQETVTNRESYDVIDYSILRSTSLIEDSTHAISSVKNTREIGTQTDIEYNISKIEIMESTIRKLYEKIQILESKIKESNETSLSNCEPLLKSHGYSEGDIDSRSFEVDDACVEEQASEVGSYEDEEYESPAKRYASCNILRSYNKNCNTKDMTPIGDGHALVPSRLMRHINWNSYTSATRKLLTAVFSRRVLATHSLTGKPSPAFPNKPAKKKLDPALVNDIVQTVVEKCCVPENVVRTSITTKCADESKMYRTRQKNTKKRKQKNNTENVSSGITSNSEEEF